MLEINCQQPPSLQDLWIRNCVSSEEPLQGYVVFIHTKYGVGKYQEGTVLLFLRDKRVFYGRLRFPAKEEVRIVESLANFLNDLDWLAIPEDGLVVRIEDVIGYSIEVLHEPPEQCDSWCFKEWSQRRLVEVSMSAREMSPNQIRETVNAELVLIQERIFGAISQLSADIVLALTGIKEKIPQISWVDIHNYITTKNSLVARNREQALRLFPAMTALAIDRNNSTEYTDTLSQRIDQGCPLIDFVAERWDVRPFAVRALRNLGYDDLGEHWMPHLRHLLSILNALAPERMPKSPGQWEVFSHQAHIISALTKTPLGSESGKLLMISASRKHWQKSLDLSVDIIEKIRVLEGFSRDLVSALKIWIYLEKSMNQTLPSEATLHQLVSAAFMSYGLEKAVKLAVLWRASDVRSRETEQAFAGDFPLLLESPFFTEGGMIFQLKRADDLRNESLAMQHCVDSYVAACKSGMSVICSVRCKAGSRQSTFEMSVKCVGINAYQTRLIQHKGVGNAAPPAKAQESLISFMRFLKEAEGKECLRRFSREKLLINFDEKLARNHRMANRIREFLNDNSSGRLNFDELVEISSRERLKP